MIWILHILLFNLTIVLLTELTLGFFLGATSLKKLLTLALANIITNPVVVLSSLSLTLFLSTFHPIGLLILELLAFLTEGFIFSKCHVSNTKNPYIISLLLNVASFGIGEIINIIF
ncbi:MAG: hypothetical protein IJE10_03815 [Clostridia bacterium]|nr:hypothetical protein [Clostridia bacterium]